MYLPWDTEVWVVHFRDAARAGQAADIIFPPGHKNLFMLQGIQKKCFEIFPKSAHKKSTLFAD